MHDTSWSMNPSFVFRGPFTERQWFQSESDRGGERTSTEYGQRLDLDSSSGLSSVQACLIIGGHDQHAYLNID